MKLLLAPLGSHGDIHPFIALGQELARRQHDVTVIASAYFQSLVEQAGLKFVELFSAEEYHESIQHPDLWHPTRGVKFVFSHMCLEPMRKLYELIAERIEPGNTKLVASSLGLGALLAREKLDVPMVTIQLAPSSLRSVVSPPVLPGVWFPDWSPLWYRRFLFWISDVLIIDPIILKELNAFRSELGLPPVCRLLENFWNSPDLVLGLFPKWFAEPAADWPSQFRQCDFPLYDEADLHALSPDLEAFLQAGDPPLLFTPGSAMVQGQKFFAVALEAVQQLNQRAIFLTRSEQHLPNPLPETVAHFSYIPFSRVFPRVRVVIHHGGIGTTSQALAAGVPQLITPFGFDQFDNAARVIRLRAGSELHPSKLTGEHLANALSNLESENYRIRCAEIQKWANAGAGVQSACDWIERCPEIHTSPTSEI